MTPVAPSPVAREHVESPSLARPENQFDTTLVHAAGATYTLSNRGGIPTSVILEDHQSRHPADKSHKVELLGAGKPLANYWLLLGRDTIALDTIIFHVAREQTASHTSTRYTASVGARTMGITYTFPSDRTNDYLITVSATVSNGPPESALLIKLPETIHSNEADTVDDLNHLAISYRPRRGDVNSVAFSKLDSAEVRHEGGPINWVAIRNKYFLVAFRAVSAPFSALQLQRAFPSGKIPAHALVNVTLPLTQEGGGVFEIYAGPQNFERLQQLGGDLDQVNPYAGWLHGVVQPFATIVMKALLWMKRTTQLNYGWVLVLFGVIIRLILWPLNQGAMRTSMKMQRLQPELQALQKKHSDDPKRQQEAIMKVYKEHGMSPLSPLMGCLPMLLPMPVLFALYYVFQNTIEFRGVPFLWLPDISLRDPFYITPLLMGASMFVMSWIGMRNSPPNPQAKMMGYMMPVMLTVLFLNFASGLNLYYAVQNVAALPQQWLLARERGKGSGQATPIVERNRT